MKFIKERKVAQLLNERAELKRDIKDLQDRINQNLLVQEGDKPQENIASLMTKLSFKISHIWKISVIINESNLRLLKNEVETDLDPTNVCYRSIMHALSERDRCRQLSKVFKSIADGLIPQQGSRYGITRNEVKFIPSESPKQYRKLYQNDS